MFEALNNLPRGIKLYAHVRHMLQFSGRQKKIKIHGWYLKALQSSNKLEKTKFEIWNQEHKEKIKNLVRVSYLK